MPSFGISFAVQLIIYLLLWLYDDYLASYLSAIFGSIYLLIWLFSLFFELIERTRISRRYFHFMLAGFLAPLCGFLFYMFLGGGPKWIN